jgi:hypothetical protein
LELEYCRITEAGGRVIADALENNTSITRLEMGVLRDEIGALVTRNKEIKACHFDLKWEIIFKN